MEVKLDVPSSDLELNSPGRHAFECYIRICWSAEQMGASSKFSSSESRHFLRGISRPFRLMPPGAATTWLAGWLAGMRSQCWLLTTTSPPSAHRQVVPPPTVARQRRSPNHGPWRRSRGPWSHLKRRPPSGLAPQASLMKLQRLLVRLAAVTTCYRRRVPVKGSFGVPALAIAHQVRSTY